MNACPLDPGWRLWTMFHNRYDRVSPEDAARIAASHQAWPGAIVQSFYPRWETADDDGSRLPMTVGESQDVPWRFDKDSPWHVHTEFSIDSDVVHIDICGATRFAPRSFWNETRIHVNGELRGRAGTCGCSLGGGAWEGNPAVGVVFQHVVLVDATPNMQEAVQRGSVKVTVRRRDR